MPAGLRPRKNTVRISVHALKDSRTLIQPSTTEAEKAVFGLQVLLLYWLGEKLPWPKPQNRSNPKPERERCWYTDIAAEPLLPLWLFCVFPAESLAHGKAGMEAHRPHCVCLEPTIDNYLSLDCWLGWRKELRPVVSWLECKSSPQTEIWNLGLLQLFFEFTNI